MCSVTLQLCTVYLLCLRLTEQVGSWRIAPLDYHGFWLPTTFAFHHDFQSSQCKFTLAGSMLIIVHTPCRELKGWNDAVESTALSSVLSLAQHHLKEYS